MTLPEANYTGGLGGLQNGGYWQALAQASGGAANASSATYLGALGPAAAAYTSPEPEPLEDAGIRAGEIIAYRCWFLIDGLLHSMSANFVWFPGVIERAHRVGEEWGTGLHAFKTLERGRAEYTFASVWGEVSLWGDVIEHEHGYRAEFASIRKIISVSPDIPVLKIRRRILQRRYCKARNSGLENDRLKQTLP